MAFANAHCFYVTSEKYLIPSGALLHSDTGTAISHVGMDENRVFWVVRKYKPMPGNQQESRLSATSRL